MRRLKKYQNPAGPLSHFWGWDPNKGFVEPGELDASVAVAYRPIKKIAWTDNTQLNLPGDSFNANLYNEEVDTSDSDKMAASLAEKQARKDARKGRRLSGENGGFPMQGVSNVLAGLGGAASMFAPLVQKENTSFTGQQQIGNALMSTGNPYLAAAGGIYNVASFAAEAAGLNTNLMSKSQANAAGVSKLGRIANNVLSYIPFTGWGGKTNTAYTSEAVNQIGDAFAGTRMQMQDAYSMGDQRYAIGKNKANDAINESNNNNTIMTRLWFSNTLRKQNTANQDLREQYFNRIHGGNGDVISSKFGSKLLSREELDRIYHTKDISKFQNGGSILIPEGELHARKHHMDEVNPELAEELTQKGIPVITTDSKANVTQVAEIEKEEMVLEKNLTDKIEELRKEGTDESAIEAGKLIVDTLFNNCDDNADLIKRVE